MKCSVTCIREFFKVWWRSIFDLITILLLLFLFIGLYVAENNGSVVKRGFYCDDVSIRFPFRESTVPIWALVVSVLSIPLVAVSQIYLPIQTNSIMISINYLIRVSLGLAPRVKL